MIVEWQKIPNIIAVVHNYYDTNVKVATATCDVDYEDGDLYIDNKKVSEDEMIGKCKVPSYMFDETRTIYKCMEKYVEEIFTSKKGAEAARSIYKALNLQIKTEFLRVFFGKSKYYSIRLLKEVIPKELALMSKYRIIRTKYGDMPIDNPDDLHIYTTVHRMIVDRLKKLI